MSRLQYKKTPLHIAIISARRPDNVQAMEAWFERPDLVSWYVSDADAEAYEQAAQGQVFVGGGLMQSRNLALEQADLEGLWCAQLSDDLEWLRYSPTNSRQDWYEISVLRALRILYQGARAADARLAGVSPTNNPYFVNKDLNPKGFCLGDMFVADPSTGLRFDENIRLKEDYDFTLQHLWEFGIVARMERVLPSFSHRRNDGGAVSYRTAEVEQETISYLMEKWPGALRLNPRRENEVIMQWPPKKGSELRRKLDERGQ